MTRRGTPRRPPTERAVAALMAGAARRQSAEHARPTASAVAVLAKVRTVAVTTSAGETPPKRNPREAMGTDVAIRRLCRRRSEKYLPHSTSRGEGRESRGVSKV